MTDFKNILNVLKKNDPKLGNIIDLIKPQFDKKTNDEFTSLVKIIIGQQLSGSAAKKIVERLEKILEQKTFLPNQIANMPNEYLRKCGISNAKITYIKGFSEILLDEPNFFTKLKHKTENEILDELCKIKGVGIWTASIFAMGTLGYENIFPYGDASINKAIKLIYCENTCQQEIIAKWTPYKSFACRILWQWIDKGMPR